MDIIRLVKNLSLRGKLLSNDIITKHKLETTLNEKGEILLVDEWQTKQRRVNIKIGWFRMYKEMLDVFAICNSNLENRILIHILDNTKKNFTINIKINNLAKDFEASRMKISSFIKKLKDADFIKGDRGIFMVNPKMFVPQNASNEIVKELQDDWNNIEG